MSETIKNLDSIIARLDKALAHLDKAEAILAKQQKPKDDRFGLVMLFLSAVLFAVFVLAAITLRP